MRRSITMAASPRSTEAASESSFELPSGKTPLEMTYLEVGFAPSSIFLRAWDIIFWTLQLMYRENVVVLEFFIMYSWFSTGVLKNIVTRSSQLKSLFPSSSNHIHICGLHGGLSPGYLPLLGIFWQIQIKKQNVIVSELQGLSKNYRKFAAFRFRSTIRVWH